MKNMSVMQLFKKTLPFLLARIMVYGIFGLCAIVFVGIMIGIGVLAVKMFGDTSAVVIFILIAALGVVFGGLKFIERYVLYMVKIGHISVIAELLTIGEIPDGKGQVSINLSFTSYYQYNKYRKFRQL